MRPLQKPVSQSGVFTEISKVTMPEDIQFDTDKGKSQKFTISFISNGTIPFPQVIIRVNGTEHIFNSNKITSENNVYTVQIPDGELAPGTHSIQIEGCRKTDWQHSSGEDWIKWFGQIRVSPSSTQAKTNPASTVNSKKKV